jgi:ribosomal protein L7/L12
MRAGQKISVIKLYRELHNVDLKTANEAAEALGRARRPGASAVEAPEDPARCAPVSTITV